MCHPMGGLNDTLCQIVKCLSYAIKSNRKLVIDTRTNPKFMENIGEYLMFRDPWNEVASFIANDSTEHPNRIVRQLVQNQRAVYLEDRFSFDFSKNYKDEVIHHRQSGGGLSSRFALQIFEPTSRLRALWDVLMAEVVTDDYEIVNIRNLDEYKTPSQTIDDVLKEYSKLPRFYLSDDTTLQNSLNRNEDSGVFEVPHTFQDSKFTKPFWDFGLIVRARRVRILPFQGFSYRFSGFSRFAKFSWACRTNDWSVVSDLDGISDLGHDWLDNLANLAVWYPRILSMKRTELPLVSPLF